MTNSKAVSRLWTAAILCAALVASMTSGYIAMRITASRTLARPAAEGAPGAVHAQAFAGELVRLMDSYLDRERKLSGDEMAAWIRSDFTPALNDLRRRMLAAPAGGAPMAALLDACDKAAQMARLPGRPDLRITATESVLEAASVAQGASGG